MKSAMRLLISLCLTIVFIAPVQAAFTASSGEIKVGEWNTRVSDIKVKAEKENIPVIAVGTAFGCTYCNQFYSILQSQKFKDWVAKSPYLFIYCYSGTGHWLTGEHAAFATWFGSGALPRIGYYWKKKDGTIVGGKEKSFAGRGVSADSLIKIFDEAFKDYSPTTQDDWDPADNVVSGATELTNIVAGATLTHVHTLDSAVDSADWFKIPVEKGKKYRFGIEKLNSESESVMFEAATGTNIVMDIAGSVTNIFASTAAEASTNALVFTALESGVVEICVSVDANSNAKASYALAYREYEDVEFSLKETAISVKENAAKAVLTVLRSGRLTDDVAVLVTTADGTAKAGVNYKAMSASEVVVGAGETNATFDVEIIDFPGTTGNLEFSVTVVNPENKANCASANVVIEDLDLPTDASDPGDDLKSGARRFEFTNQTQTMDSSSVLSSQDKVDWFKFAPFESGKTYQIKVPKGAYARRAGENEPDPEVTFYLPDGGVITNMTLRELEETPLRYNFVQRQVVQDEALYLSVTNKSSDSGVFTYSFAWQEWVLPIVSIDELSEITSKGNETKQQTITLSRTMNLEEEIAVTVAVDSVDGRIAASTNVVIFAAGAETAEFTITLSADGGLWKSNETFKVTVLEDDTVHQNIESAVHEREITLKTEMPEFDNDDGDSDINKSMLNATEMPVSKRPTTRSQLTLNGSDKIDWYKFAVTNGVEYAFELVGLDDAYQTNGVLSVELLLPGEDDSVQIDMTNCVGSIVRFVALQDGWAGICVKKIKDEPVSLAYGLKYREWVPATIELVDSAVEVSEFASFVRVGVRCVMDVPLPVDIMVRTCDGSATAGEDYVTIAKKLTWNETSSTTSVKYVEVPLKKLVSEYEGESETFRVYLDFETSDAIEGEIVEQTVTIAEVDKGVVGNFSIDAYKLGDAEFSRYRASAVAATAGETGEIRIIRKGGNAGKVTVSLTWANSVAKPIEIEFGDLETEKVVQFVIPETEGAYASRQTYRIAMKTSDKNAKVVNGTLTFAVTDNDLLMSTYAKDKANIPFVAAGNTWYVSAEGSVRSKTLKAKSVATLSASLNGSGVLSFRPVIEGEGEIIVKAGNRELEQTEVDGVVSVTVPSGMQRVTVAFRAGVDGAWMSLEDVIFEPSAEFNRIGTFNGMVGYGDEAGAAKITVAKSGRFTGKFTFPSNKVWTVTGVLDENGETGNAVVRRMKDIYESVQVKISEDGSLQLQSAESVAPNFDAVAYRDAWNDRPLPQSHVGYSDLLGKTLELSDGAGINLTFRISARGIAQAAGTVDGRRVSASATVVVEPDGDSAWLAPCFSGIESVDRFIFKKENEVWSVTIVE